MYNCTYNPFGLKVVYLIHEYLSRGFKYNFSEILSSQIVFSLQFLLSYVSGWHEFSLNIPHIHEKSKISQVFFLLEKQTQPL